MAFFEAELYLYATSSAFHHNFVSLLATDKTPRLIDRLLNCQTFEVVIIALSNNFNYTLSVKLDQFTIFW